MQRAEVNLLLMEPLPPTEETRRPLHLKLLHYLGYITVEPTMVCYMMAFMVTTVVEQSLFVYKACKVNHGFNDTVCRHINEKKYENFTKTVQITVSNFHLWNDVAGHGGQIILAMFMGAWSDKRGRKLPLLIGLLGKLYYSSMIVVNCLKESWPLEYIIYSATLPMAFTGADVIIFAAAFSYIVDISSPEYRTLRITLLEVCYLATMPLGIALGSFLYRKVVGESYTIMFSINVALLATSVIYTFVRLQWLTNPRQRSITEASNLFKDFFDYNHVVDTAKTVCKSRPNNKRGCLLLLLLVMSLYVFQRDERNMSYLYCQLVFGWSFGQYSNFRTYQSALQDVGLLLGVPVMIKLLGWKDSVVVMVGAAAHSLARAFYAGARVSWVFYIGGVFAAFGPVVAPVVRSMVSKIVATSEKGKAFSVLSVADNAVPIISGVFYSKLYNATIHNIPEAIFYLTMATQIAVFLIILYVNYLLKDSDNQPDDITEAQQDNKLEVENLNDIS